MKVLVDTATCSGHARCFEAAPEIFDLDEAGYAAVSSADVPGSLTEKALLAIASCPERAITVVEQHEVDRVSDGG